MKSQTMTPPALDVEKTREMRRSMALRGAIAGMAGAVALALSTALSSVVLGGDPWLALKIAAASLMGNAALLPGSATTTLFVGMMVNTAVGAGWGAVFGRIFYSLEASVTLAAGLLWGLVVWIPMYFLVLPLIGGGTLGTLAATSVTTSVHLVFGLVTAVVFSAIQKDYGRRDWDHSYSRWWDSE